MTILKVKSLKFLVIFMSLPPFNAPPTIVYTGKDGRKEVFKLHEELGRGGFAYVYRVTQQNTNKEYAMKIISKQFLNSKNISVFEKLKNELKIQRALNHPNIVKSKMSFSDDLNYYIVLEYCPGKSIREYLKNSDLGYLSEPQTRKILRDIMKGLVYLHNNNVIHHDIKIENFIVGANGIVKIADFGLSTILDNQKTVSICGTINYIAPEVLKKEGNGFEVDIWAMGVAAFIMLTGQAPFGNSKDIIYKNILSCNYCFPTKIQISQEAKNFIKSILKLNPKERPTAADLSNHPFLTKLDTELIEFYRPIQKVQSMALFQPYQKVQALKQIQYFNTSQSSSDSSPKIDTRLPARPPAKSRPPIPSQSSQKVQQSIQMQSPQKVQPNIQLQSSRKIQSQIQLISSQKARLPTPSQKVQQSIQLQPSQKVEPTQKLAAEENFNIQKTKKELSTSRLRSASVNNARKLRQPIELNNNDNEVNLIRHNSSSSRKSSATNSRRNFTIPNYFVTKFCIYEDDIGYLLGNGIVGTCFKDSSRIVMDPSESFIQYYKNYESSFETINIKEKLSNVKDSVFVKYSLVMRFANMFKKTKNLNDAASKNINPNLPLLNVKYFLCKNDSFLFKFSDRNIQVNFSDHTKMIIFANNKKVCFLRSMTDKCCLLDLNEVANMNADSDERQKFKNAKLLLNDLSKKIQNQIDNKL